MINLTIVASFDVVFEPFLFHHFNLNFPLKIFKTYYDDELKNHNGSTQHMYKTSHDSKLWAIVRP